jgi:hypothetical protein
VYLDPLWQAVHTKALKGRHHLLAFWDNTAFALPLAALFCTARPPSAAALLLLVLLITLGATTMAGGLTLLDTLQVRP